MSGGGDGSHSHAHFWAQAQVVRAQWRVQVQAGPGGVQWPGQAFSTLLSGIMERPLPSPEGRMQGSEDTASLSGDTLIMAILHVLQTPQIQT